MKSILLIVCLLTLSATALAQEPQKSELRLVVKDDRPKLWHWSDGVFLGATMFDFASSNREGVYEKNSLLADSNGHISIGKTLGVKLGMFGLIKVAEWRMPQHRKGLRIMKLVTAAGFTALAAHNMTVGR